MTNTDTKPSTVKTLRCEVNLQPTTTPARIVKLEERIALDKAELAKLTEAAVAQYGGEK